MNDCRKCGHQVPSATLFCPNCGAKIQEDEHRVGTTDGELVAFVGPKASYYLSRFRKFRFDGIGSIRPSWNWGAFLAGPFWAFYRKLYLFGLIGCFLLLIPYTSILAYIIPALFGNSIYYRHALQIIASAKKESRSMEMALAQISSEGGVNRWLMVASMVFCIILVIAIALAVFMLKDTLRKHFGSGVLNI